MFLGQDLGNLLSLNWAILPELLQDAGYVNYIAGKWDLGALEGYSPATRGFDRSFVNIGASNSHFADRVYEYPFMYQDEGNNLANEDLPVDFYATRYYTDKMIEFIQSNDGEQPWFAFVPYTTPHWPLGLPDDWLDRHVGSYDSGYDTLRESRVERAKELGILSPDVSLASYESSTVPWQDLDATQQQRHARAQEIYAGMVEYMDMSIGRIVTYLEESGQLENTVIMFSSDHGASSGTSGLAEGAPVRSAIANASLDNSIENFGRPKSWIDHGVGFGEAATAPFKYSKGTLSEGGLRAAAFVYYPKAVASGVSHTLMGMVDILPTFLEVAGTGHPGASSYKGREINDIVGTSFWPYLTGRSDSVRLSTDSLGWFGGGRGALIQGDYKIINQVGRGGGMGTAQGSVPPWRLYNITLDPGETDYITSEPPELVSELAGDWEANWR